MQYQPYEHAREACYHIAEHGDIQASLDAYNHYLSCHPPEDDGLNESLFMDCCTTLEQVKTFHTLYRFPLTDHLLQLAAGRGNIPIMEYCLQNGVRWSSNVYLKAVQYWQLNAIQYAHSKGYRMNKYVALRAALCGAYDCLDFILQVEPTIDPVECMREASTRQQLRCVQITCKYASQDMIDTYLPSILVKHNESIKDWMSMRSWLFSCYHKYPSIQLSPLGTFVGKKLEEIHLQMEYVTRVCREYLPVDVIKHCITPYF